MAKHPVSEQGWHRHEERKKVLINCLAELEEFPLRRNQWLQVMPSDAPLLPERRDTKYAERWLYLHFTRPELDEIERKAIDKRIAKYGPKILHVLDNLYDLAVNSGDVSAAKEFLNRTLGQSKQKVTMEYETGDNLTSLLQQINPTQAYTRPKVDENGREIIELSLEDANNMSKLSNDEEDNDDTEE